MKNWKEESINRLAFLSKVEFKNSLSLKEIDILIKYAIEEKDLSSNGYFLKPCIESIGVIDVSQKILNYYQKGSFYEKAGALKLWYWAYENTVKLDPHNFKQIEIKSALENNFIEYKKRLEHLSIEFKNCQNPILKFLFKWAICREPQF